MSDYKLLTLVLRYYEQLRDLAGMQIPELEALDKDKKITPKTSHESQGDAAVQIERIMFMQDSSDEKPPL